MPTMNKVELISGPPLSRAVPAGIEIVDDAERRLRISFASTMPVLRTNYWDEPWLEVLSHAEGGPDFSTVESGAVPVMRDHRMYELNEQVGVVERAWVEGDKSYADIRLSKRDDVSPLFADIKDKIVRNVSVTYNAGARVLTKINSDGPNEYTVTNWVPLEISFVPVPADSSVGVGRSFAGDNARYSLRAMSQQETAPMANDTTTPIDPVNPPAVTDDTASRAAAHAADVAKATADTLKRAADIGELCAAHSMPSDFTRDVISRGISVEAVGLEILKRSKTTTPGGTAPAATGDGKGDAEPAAIAAGWSRAIGRVSPRNLKH